MGYVLTCKKCGDSIYFQNAEKMDPGVGEFIAEHDAERGAT